MVNLTPRQLSLVEFIVEYRDEKGLFPTLEEMAGRFGVSKVTIFEHLRALEAKGLIQRQRQFARAIKIMPKLKEYLKERALKQRQTTLSVQNENTAPEINVSLPVLGRIAAGQPIEAIEDRETLDFSDLIRQDRDVFVLQVTGESMIEDQIRDGDYVICERREVAQNGETVVALLPDGEATLKRFYKEDNRFRLQPANSTMEPIYTDKVQIQGIVVGVLRRYGQPSLSARA